MKMLKDRFIYKEI